MLPRSKTAGSTSSTVSVAIGVILGAALTFCIQVYSNQVEDQRTARHDRAHHIERAMIATKNMVADADVFPFKIVNLLRKESPATNWEKSETNSPAISELRTVTALYLPEVQTEADQLFHAYQSHCLEAWRAVPADLSKPDTSKLAIDEEGFSKVIGAASALNNKLIELAKQNRQ
jgi:hypothetical protein